MLRYLKTILKSLFSNPQTRKKQREPFKGARGNVHIDMDQCILCGICSKQCPVGAIKVNKEEGSWEIDKFRCIVCEYCSEKCPKKCLTIKNDYTKSALEKSKFIIKKEQKADN